MNKEMAVVPRFLLSAPRSGSGKTLITCGIIAALKGRGLSVSSFKCGPDYIDPMFHSRILRAKARNLDTFFTDRETTRYLLAQGAKGTDISVVEGVMGYYDGLGGVDTRASAYDVADATGTPAVLIVDTKGMSLSVLAELKGFLTYRENSHIKGVILNRMSPMLYREIKEVTERELGIRVYGYVPNITEFTLESRHLGLVLPDEVKELEEKFSHLGKLLEESLDIEGLVKLAEKAPKLAEGRREAVPPKLQQIFSSPVTADVQKAAPRIAVARDEAFCFIYEDNLRLLEKLGGKLVFFSPLHDEGLPEDTDGLILYGGYPELYAKELSANVSMRLEIKERLSKGLPCMAECGGFMYLHSFMEDMEGNRHEMAGAVKGEAYRTERLSRFGYIELTGNTESILGGGAGVIPAHEFHYFDSTSPGCSFHAGKPLRKRSWECIHGTKNQILGFPHLYYHGNPQVALQFLEACVRGREE